MEIYIKPEKKVKLSNVGKVKLHDLAEVFAPAELQKRVENVKILNINATKNKNYLVSVIDIIKAVDTALPGHTIVNVGEMDTLIDYAPEQSNGNKVVKWISITFVSLCLLAGSATAIMSFHSDAQIPLAFQNYYYIFFNEKVENPFIIDIPYSIGLAAGIIIFFNHFMGKKITDDPTPIEVEMAAYEKEVEDTLIATLDNRSDENDNS